MNFKDILKAIPDVAKEVPDIAEKYLELARRLPLRVNREDMLEWAGVPRRRGVLLPSVVAFGTGFALGAATALMLAPSSGAELRKELLERLRKRAQGEAEPVVSVEEPEEAEPEAEVEGVTN